MKRNRMPTTRVLLVFSWLIAIFGLFGGGFLIIFRFNELNSLIIGFSILLGSLLLGGVIRMFGNIGQMLFDLKGFLFSNLQTLIHRFDILSQDTKETKEILGQNLQELSHSFSSNLQTLIHRFDILSQDTKETKEILGQNLQELNHLSCDSKDINQNITQIKTFFEQIERHLDLKK